MKLFKCVLDTRAVSKHCVCASVTAGASDYSAVSVPSFTDKWSVNYSRDWRAALLCCNCVMCVLSAKKKARGLYFTYRWPRGPLKAIWSSFTSDPLDSDRACTSRWAYGATLPPSSLRTLRTPVSNLQSRLTASAGQSQCVHQRTMRNEFSMDTNFNWKQKRLEMLIMSCE